jgi:hypothetical protein
MIFFMVLKYAAALKTRPDQPCPGTSFQPRAVTAFRFLHNTATEADFEPRPEYATPKAKCAAYAISLWESLEKAQARYKSLAAAHDDNGATAVARYGDHIGEIDLSEADGVLDAPNKAGHFGLHPAEGAVFASRVKVYTPCEYLTHLYVTANNDV